MSDAMIFVTYPNSVVCLRKQDARKTPCLLFVYETALADRMLSIAKASDLEYTDPRVHTFGEAIALVWKIENTTTDLITTIRNSDRGEIIETSARPATPGDSLVAAALAPLPYEGRTQLLEEVGRAGLCNIEIVSPLQKEKYAVRWQRLVPQMHFSTKQPQFIIA